MAEKTGIEWTNHTWNPWIGCEMISPGCANCYMFTEQTRYKQDPNQVRKTKPGTFNAPLRWKEPARVFTCSWSDFFIKEADEWRDEAWAIIKSTPHLTYQILTKRPERITDHLPPNWGKTGYPNVWLGVTAENQKQADIRIPSLIEIPAVVRFLSCEPLLGPLDLSEYLYRVYYTQVDEEGNVSGEAEPLDNLHWIICGGESGPKARPMSPEWARSLRDQCQEWTIPFFFKQVGEWAWEHSGSLSMANRAMAYKHNTTFHRVGKKLAGRFLDGRGWSEFPQIEGKKVVQTL